MATKISASAARETARKKLLSRYESALDALAEFERLNYDSQMKQLKNAREKAIEKADAKFASEVERLRGEVAPVIVHLREALSMSEVSEHTGFTRTEQKALIELAQSRKDSGASSEQSANKENAGNDAQ